MHLVSVSSFRFCLVLVFESAIFLIHLGVLPGSFLVDVHPYSVCEKLGAKYASVSVDELNKCHDFYEDLLRYLAMVVNLDKFFN